MPGRFLSSIRKAVHRQSSSSRVAKDAEEEELISNRESTRDARDIAHESTVQEPPAPPLDREATLRGIIRPGDITSCELASLVLHEALNLRHFDAFPQDQQTWLTYKRYYCMEPWFEKCVFGLLSLTIFETPLWCRHEGSGFWDWGTPDQKCKQGGIPQEKTQLSGVPMLPLGVSLIIEWTLLLTILYRVFLHLRLRSGFKKVGTQYHGGEMAAFVTASLAVLALCDALFLLFYPTSKHRISPFVRFGLAADIPWVKQVIFSFWRALKSIWIVGVFLIGAIILFAWVAAMVFNDLSEIDQYGLAINFGFETYGHSLYTMFVTMTTVNLPDAMIPTYEHSTWSLLFWMPFLFVNVCVFTQVVLAIVYNEYQGELTTRVKEGHDKRLKGIDFAFNLLEAQTGKSLSRGNTSFVVYNEATMADAPSDSNAKAARVVGFESFVKLVTHLRSFSRISFEESWMRTVFFALDLDRSGTLTNIEFRNMCEVIMMRFRATKRDSCVRTGLQGTRAGDLLCYLLQNDSAKNGGPDLGVEENENCRWDKIVLVMVGFNVFWLIVESCLDFNDIEHPEWFAHVDFFFSFIYLADVFVKLCWWTFSEYWIEFENRFDLFTTIVLAGAALCVIFYDVPHDILKYLNLFRLGHVFKALKNIEVFQKEVSIIIRMCSTCGDVLAMNLLVIYFWSAWGMQLFGGQFYEENPLLQGKGGEDYFTFFYEVFNFNDMVSGMVTMFFITIGGWVNPVAVICMNLYEDWSFNWWATCVFWASFYLASPLIAFNVWTAFSIDVFCKLEMMVEDTEKTPMELSLEKIQAEKANDEGICLHIQHSSALVKERVYKAMFDEERSESEDEIDEKGSKTKPAGRERAGSKDSRGSKGSKGSKKS